MATSVQQSLASQLGIPQELATCVQPTSQVGVEHKNYTLHTQNTNQSWVTKQTTYNPQMETVSVNQVQHPDLNIAMPCPAQAAPCAQAVAAPCAAAVAAPVALAAGGGGCCWTTGNIPNGGSQISGIGAGYGSSYVGLSVLGVGQIGGPLSAYGPIGTLYRQW